MNAGAPLNPNPVHSQSTGRAVVYFAAAVLSGWRGGHSQDVFCFDLAKNALECKSREMMAFVDDDVAVLGYKIMNYALVL
jgi:hypothetical protein